ncbi:hypothetical protein MBANPS3_009785 [Mucor bainieri]
MEVYCKKTELDDCSNNKIISTSLLHSTEPVVEVSINNEENEIKFLQHKVQNVSLVGSHVSYTNLYIVLNKFGCLKSVNVTCILFGSHICIISNRSSQNSQAPREATGVFRKDGTAQQLCEKDKHLYLVKEDGKVAELPDEPLPAAKEKAKREQMGARPVLQGMPEGQHPITDSSRLSKHTNWPMHPPACPAPRSQPKATKAEPAVFDQAGGRTLPIGLLWLKISDIAENLCKQTLELEQHESNWGPA